jgi:hypothetical protein
MRALTVDLFRERILVVDRGVNDTILLIYLIRTVFDKMSMGKFFFVNLFDMGKDKNFISLSK